MSEGSILAMIGGTMLGKFTTTTLLIIGSLVAIMWTYKSFIWPKVKP